MMNMKGAVQCSADGRWHAMWNVGATSTKSTDSSSASSAAASTFFLSDR